MQNIFTLQTRLGLERQRRAERKEEESEDDEEVEE